MSYHTLNLTAQAIGNAGSMKQVNTAGLVALDTERKSIHATRFERDLLAKVVGQVKTRRFNK